ncbi:MAG: hypothetical protein ACXWNG_05760, partial [Candidatus Limnocylindrales bacterium]
AHRPDVELDENGLPIERPAGGGGNDGGGSRGGGPAGTQEAGSTEDEDEDGARAIAPDILKPSSFKRSR